MIASAPTACCPTCGSAVHKIGGELRPILTGAQVDAAERMAWSLLRDDPRGFDQAARDFADAGSGDPTPINPQPRTEL